MAGGMVIEPRKRRVTVFHIECRGLEGHSVDQRARCAEASGLGLRHSENFHARALAAEFVGDPEEFDAEPSSRHPACEAADDFAIVPQADGDGDASGFARMLLVEVAQAGVDGAGGGTDGLFEPNRPGCAFARFILTLGG